MTQSRIPFFLIVIFSVLVGLASLRFLVLGMPLSFPDMPGHIHDHIVAFTVHVTASPIALICGGLQFFPKFRARRPTIHRWVGRIYGGAVLVAGLSGIVIANAAAGGISPAIGFSLLSVVWIAVTANAIRLARAGRIAEHRRWMFRSFALTFAAVTLRLYIPMFMLGGLDYTAASIYLAWICWVPNLVFMEWWLRR